MKIEILCPKCGLVLKDKFECPSVKISEITVAFNMECYKCEKYYCVNLSVHISVDSAPLGAGRVSQIRD